MGNWNQRRGVSDQCASLARGLTTEQTLDCRQDRNWEQFDKLSIENKLYACRREMEFYLEHGYSIYKKS